MSLPAPRPDAIRGRIGALDCAIHVGRGAASVATPERLMMALRSELLPAIEAAIEHVADLDVRVRIPVLEIDLGRHPGEPDWVALREDLRQKLIAAMLAQGRRDGAGQPQRSAPPLPDVPPRPAPERADIRQAEAPPILAADTGIAAIPQRGRDKAAEAACAGVLSELSRHLARGDADAIAAILRPALTGPFRAEMATWIIAHAPDLRALATAAGAGVINEWADLIAPAGHVASADRQAVRARISALLDTILHERASASTKAADPPFPKGRTAPEPGKVPGKEATPPQETRGSRDPVATWTGIAPVEGSETEGRNGAAMGQTSAESEAGVSPTGDVAAPARFAQDRFSPNPPPMHVKSPAGGQSGGSDTTPDAAPGLPGTEHATAPGTGLPSPTPPDGDDPRDGRDRTASGGAREAAGASDMGARETGAPNSESGTAREKAARPGALFQSTRGPIRGPIQGPIRAASGHPGTAEAPGFSDPPRRLPGATDPRDTAARVAAMAARDLADDTGGTRMARAASQPPTAPSPPSGGATPAPPARAGRTPSAPATPDACETAGDDTGPASSEPVREPSVGDPAPASPPSSRAPMFRPAAATRGATGHAGHHATAASPEAGIAPVPGDPEQDGGSAQARLRAQARAAPEALHAALVRLAARDLADLALALTGQGSASELAQSIARLSAEALVEVVAAILADRPIDLAGIRQTHAPRGADGLSAETPRPGEAISPVAASGAQDPRDRATDPVDTPARDNRPPDASARDPQPPPSAGQEASAAKDDTPRDPQSGAPANDRDPAPTGPVMDVEAANMRRSENPQAPVTEPPRPSDTATRDPGTPARDRRDSAGPGTERALGPVSSDRPALDPGAHTPDQPPGAASQGSRSHKDRPADGRDVTSAQGTADGSPPDPRTVAADAGVSDGPGAKQPDEAGDREGSMAAAATLGADPASEAPHIGETETDGPSGLFPRVSEPERAPKSLAGSTDPAAARRSAPDPDDRNPDDGRKTGQPDDAGRETPFDPRKAQGAGRAQEIRDAPRRDDLNGDAAPGPDQPDAAQRRTPLDVRNPDMSVGDVPAPGAAPVPTDRAPAPDLPQTSDIARTSLRRETNRAATLPDQIAIGPERPGPRRNAGEATGDSPALDAFLAGRRILAELTPPDRRSAAALLASRDLETLSGALAGQVAARSRRFFGALDLIWATLPAPLREPPFARAGYLAELAHLAALPAPRQDDLIGALARLLEDLDLSDPDARHSALRITVARLGYVGAARAAEREAALAALHRLAPVLLPDPEARDGTTRVLAGRESRVAGLVLFGPYLRRLFATTGLIASDARLTEERLPAALGMLIALSQGPAADARPADPLEGVLLGLAPGVTVEPTMPGAADLAVIEGLLGAVIAQWTALGKTSPDGLRQAFVCRQGLLEALPEARHRLQVYPGPFDLLLDRLPFSITPLRLPWMDGALDVRWRQSDD